MCLEERIQFIKQDCTHLSIGQNHVMYRDGHKSEFNISMLYETLFFAGLVMDQLPDLPLMLMLKLELAGQLEMVIS